VPLGSCSSSCDAGTSSSSFIVTHCIHSFAGWNCCAWLQLYDFCVSVSIHLALSVNVHTPIPREWKGSAYYTLSDTARLAAFSFVTVQCMLCCSVHRMISTVSLCLEIHQCCCGRRRFTAFMAMMVWHDTARVAALSSVTVQCMLCCSVHRMIRSVSLCLEIHQCCCGRRRFTAFMAMMVWHE
jgi:hypothetical protein